MTAGRYPQEGKLDETDEGELTLAISCTYSHVRIDFGKPVEWIALTPEEAVGLAQLLMEYAEHANGGE